MTDPLETLREYQQWRRGGEGEMLPPKVIGQAIDAVIAELTARRFEGDTCGRVCEGTAYRITARQQTARADGLAAKLSGWREVGEAAQAVVTRWDTPRWKDVPATAEYINRLRNAIDKASAGD